MALSIDGIDFDCHDAPAVARFWAAVFDVAVQGPDHEGVCWIEPGGAQPELLFINVPEGKTVKNRVHLDLRPADQDREVARLESLGARRIDIGQGEVSWVVMADPEGNEFCVLRARSDGEEPA